MIGVFDSGIGGLTIYEKLKTHFPHLKFVYHGDHANAPYGSRTNQDILSLTQHGVEHLFNQGANLVILGCNTASAIACATLQQEWLPHVSHPPKQILGIIVPTVETVTQTPWLAKTPQFPQKYNTDTVVVFGTPRTIHSGVYSEEILKRCPNINVMEIPCPELAAAIQNNATEADLTHLITTYTKPIKEQNITPHWAILGCTHYEHAKHLFAQILPPQTRLVSQPQAVTFALEDYLTRHPEFL